MTTRRSGRRVRLAATAAGSLLIAAPGKRGLGSAVTVVSLLAVAVLTAGCSPSPDGPRVVGEVTPPPFGPVTVLDSFGGVPEGVSDPFGPDKDDALPIVDLEAGTVTLWTSGSFSCPTWPKAIRAFGGVIEIVVGLPDGVLGCTMDLRVDTYVVELPPGLAPDAAPTVRLLSQGPEGSPKVPRALPADDAGGCRPSAAVCAVVRWVDEILAAAGLDPLGDAYGSDIGADDVLVGEDRVGVTLSPRGRDGRVPIDVTRTTEVGPVVVEHGAAIDGVVPAAVLTCGGFEVRIEGGAWMSPEVLAQTAERVAAAVTACPADLDELVATYPDPARPAP